MVCINNVDSVLQRHVMQKEGVLEKHKQENKTIIVCQGHVCIQIHGKVLLVLNGNCERHLINLSTDCIFYSMKSRDLTDTWYQFSSCLIFHITLRHRNATVSC